jgi:NAD(P)-dependent dehydrogenase (short-subunit alcohol dehydrogenase family)
MMIDLHDRTILLTGASRGIGAATARRLGEAGARLVAHYGSYREGAEESVAEIPSDARLLVQADLARPG